PESHPRGKGAGDHKWLDEPFELGGKKWRPRWWEAFHRLEPHMLVVYQAEAQRVLRTLRSGFDGQEKPGIGCGDLGQSCDYARPLVWRHAIQQVPSEQDVVWALRMMGNGGESRVELLLRIRDGKKVLEAHPAGEA